MISARNQLKGKIEAVKVGEVNDIVTLKLECGNVVTATISKSAVEELELAPGKEATAVVKASEVMIAIGDLKISARNQFAGEIVEVKEGAVNAIVTLKTEGGNISATVSLDAVKELGLVSGVKAKAIVKATSVMLAV